MPKTTQLHAYHATHAKSTEFAGYEMPLWYTTTTEEHLAVRNSSGIFDVSHMGRFQVEGPKSTSFLESLVPTGVGAQPLAKAFYTLLLNERGGIIDDLIIERLAEDRYMVVVNAANTQKDLEHMTAHAPEGAGIEDMTAKTAMIALQGPSSASVLQPLTGLDLKLLKRFRCAETTVAGSRALVSRTGYTGEDGFELVVYGASTERPEAAMRVWERLLAGSTPCGLGARDSLRLEAGLPLHGSDIDESTNPYEADLAWVIAAGKGDYVGSDSLSEYGRRPPAVIRRGLVLGSGIPRRGFEVTGASGAIGTITSGAFSPIIHKGIALCQVKNESSENGTRVQVVVRDSALGGTIVKPPFYDPTLYGWKRQQR